MHYLIDAWNKAHEVHIVHEHVSEIATQHGAGILHIFMSGQEGLGAS